MLDPENFSQGGPRDNFDFQLGGGGGSEAYFQEFYEFNKFEIFLGGVGGGVMSPRLPSRSTHAVHYIS